MIKCINTFSITLTKWRKPKKWTNTSETFGYVSQAKIQIGVMEFLYAQALMM